jgi:hypothetical protein
LREEEFMTETYDKLPNREPLRTLKLPRYKGFPIPWMFWISKEGIPDFKVLDHHRVLRCAQERLCGICGVKLGRYLWFVGGKVSCEHHSFLDPPMHWDCADYSFSICPYLLGVTDFSQAAPREIGSDDLMIHSEVADSDVMGMYKTQSFEMDTYGEQRQLLFVAGPVDELIFRSRGKKHDPS